MSEDAEAREAYEAAVEQARYLRGEWEKLGKPALTSGSRGQAAQHPLLRAIHDAEMLAMRLRGDLRKRHRGPDPSAVVTPLDDHRIRRKST